LALKNLVDEGVIRYPGVLVLVTGSYSLEFYTAKRELENRMGTLGDDSQGQRFLYPLRFVEVVENVSDDIYYYLMNNSFRGRHTLMHRGERLAILEALSELRNTAIIKFIERLWGDIGKNALDHLEGMYMLTGGFPKPIYELRDQGKVSDDNYVGFFNLLVSDSGKFELDPEILTDLIKKKLQLPISEHTLSDFQIEVESAKGSKAVASRKLKPHEAKRYLDYLIEGSRILFKFKTIRPTSGFKRGFQPFESEPQKPFKIVYSDPFIFHSLFWVSQGHTRGVFDAAKDVISSSRNVRRETDWKWIIYTHLYEATVCSHVARITLLKYGEETSNYGRALHNKGEYADCIVWYYDSFVGRHHIIPVEVSVTPKTDEVINAAKLTYNNLNRRLIVVSRDELGHISGPNYEAVILPAALFLLFI